MHHYAKLLFNDDIVLMVILHYKLEVTGVPWLWDSDNDLNKIYWNWVLL